MDTIYIVIVLVLLGLAALDLVVGVANDAVNFLNSSIGSKVAPLLGYPYSRLGGGFSWFFVFERHDGNSPQRGFSSRYVYLSANYDALFGSNGYRCGFARCFQHIRTPHIHHRIADLRAVGSGSSSCIGEYLETDTGALIDYINSGKALTIISGIFISVAIAFVFGTIIMWISRLLFSFKYKDPFKYIGALWAGIALTAISYFAIFKGLKIPPLYRKIPSLIFRKIWESCCFTPGWPGRQLWLYFNIFSR